jgi:hypothetical protein
MHVASYHFDAQSLTNTCFVRVGNLQRLQQDVSDTQNAYVCSTLIVASQDGYGTIFQVNVQDLLLVRSNLGVFICKVTEYLVPTEIDQ